MEVEEKYCGWCGSKFQVKGKELYCCNGHAAEAARYQSWRGGKGKAGDAELRRLQNRENLYYRVATRLANLPSDVKIQEALGIPVWEDLRAIVVDQDAMEDLTKLENGGRIAQLLTAMQQVLALPTTATKKDWPAELQPLFAAYAGHTAAYWRKNPERLISFEQVKK